MTISEQLKAILTLTKQWAQDEGGTAHIVGTRARLLADLLALKPGAPRVISLWIDETPRGEETAASGSRVDRTFWSVLSRGQGLKLQPGASLIEGSGGGKPMYELAEDLRDLLRRMMLDPETTERPIYYAGIEPLDMGPDFLTDAMIIKIRIGTDIGIVTDEPQD